MPLDFESLKSEFSTFYLKVIVHIDFNYLPLISIFSHLMNIEQLLYVNVTVIEIYHFTLEVPVSYK